MELEYFHDFSWLLPSMLSFVFSFFLNYNPFSILFSFKTSFILILTLFQISSQGSLFFLFFFFSLNSLSSFFHLPLQNFSPSLSFVYHLPISFLFSIIIHLDYYSFYYFFFLYQLFFFIYSFLLFFPSLFSPLSSLIFALYRWPWVS